MGLGGLIAVLVVVAVAAIFVIWLPMSMAKKRDRNPWGWLLISLVFSPIVAIPALLVLGRAHPDSRV